MLAEASTAPRAVNGALAERKRLAHDVGFARGAAVDASATSLAVSCDSDADAAEALRSPGAVKSSVALDWFEATESRCALRAAFGLCGRSGTAGIIGATGRLFG